MYYYIVDNEYIFKSADGFGVKQPKLMKKYAYYKLSWSPDGSQTLLQTEGKVKELKAIPLKAAQNKVDEWTKGYDPVIKYIKDEDGKVVKEETVEATPIQVSAYDVDKFKKRAKELHIKFGEVTNG